MVKFRPLGDRVLLKRLKVDTLSPGGLILPELSQQVSNQAVVVCVGRGRVTDTGEVIPPSVFPGEHVVVAKNAGTDLKLEGEEFWLVRDHDIMYAVDHPEDK